ncbi:unnamed protein product [Penicillium roqueforti FM164]|uniref:Genomic scaffold, ProqFM164S01 n=1 Tax=Penicillium roqueforti (strain FM164) TaxID=1365484 RepID=W6Q1F8_PENRF|nr:unnamed protein product [Penicillium roqueforti FM164]
MIVKSGYATVELQLHPKHDAVSGNPLMRPCEPLTIWSLWCYRIILRGTKSQNNTYLPIFTTSRGRIDSSVPKPPTEMSVPVGISPEARTESQGYGDGRIFH